MDWLLDALPWMVGGLILALALAALRRPLGALLRLALRTAAGLGALYLLNLGGGVLGLGLGVNLANALVLGVLGLPGFGLLVLMDWALAF